MPMIPDGPHEAGISSRCNSNLPKAAQRSLGVVMSPLRDPDAPQAVRARLHVRCTRVPPFMMGETRDPDYQDTESRICTSSG
jgi:hypothetical protein